MSRLGMALGVAAIALTLVGFVGPWWTVGISATVLGQTVTSNADFRLFGGTVTATGPGLSLTNTTDYSDDPNTRSVFLADAALSGLAIAFGVVFVVVAMMAGKKPSLRRVASLCGILAFLMAFLGALYVMAALPGAVNQDSGGSSTQFTGFWGTDSAIGGFSASVVWAAGWAWYVVLVGSILFLIGGLLAMRAPKGPPMAAPAMIQTPPEPPPIP